MRFRFRTYSRSRYTFIRSHRLGVKLAFGIVDFGVIASESTGAECSTAFA
jgi:hypothetical protein